MGIFSKQKKEEESVLVFDIGSSSVGGAFFEVQGSGIPKITFSVREPIILEDKIDIDRFLILTLKSLDIVASKMCMATLGKPANIFCVLSSPWYASQTRVIKLEKNTSFSFTSKLADSLIQKEISLFKEEHSVKLSNNNNEGRPFEFKNMKTILNGYATPDPFNKKPRKLEMIVFISMGGDKILKKIEETIVRHFHFENIRFSSFAMASFAVTRDILARQEDFLLVDIGGEVTDISMVKSDVLSSSISYPLGINFMIREVAETLRCSLSEAKSLISLYKDSHAVESVEKKLEPIMNKLKSKWLDSFGKSLVDLSNDVSIPSTIFLTVDQDLADFFSDIIKTEQLSQYNLTESKFEVIVLDTKTLHGTATFGEDIIRDPFLTIESFYINRFIY